jgi:hypothetical protein
MVRQHVNPLSVLYQQPLALPSPTELFADPSLPLHLDIGAARGRFLLAMAERCPERNHLGVEIRRPLVVAASLWISLVWLSTLVARAHWPSDLLAGGAVGTAWLTLCLALWRSQRHPQS